MTCAGAHTPPLCCLTRLPNSTQGSQRCLRFCHMKKRGNASGGALILQALEALQGKQRLGDTIVLSCRQISYKSTRLLFTCILKAFLRYCTSYVWSVWMGFTYDAMARWELMLRRHLLFVEMVRERLGGASSERQRGPSTAPAERAGSCARPADLPVVGPSDVY